MNCLFFECLEMALYMRQIPETRVKEVTDGNKKVIHIAEPNLRASDHI
jgi:hypothetical protein